MKECIIIAGANGTGKTTLARQLLANTQFSFLNADDIESEITISNKNKAIIAGRLFFHRLQTMFDSNRNFCLESTLSGKYLASILRKARDQGYFIKIVYIFLDNPDICIQRIKVRVQSGGHFIPDEDVRRRFHRSKQNFWKIYRHLADEWFMYYNASENAILVAFGHQDMCTIENESFFTVFGKDI